MQTANLWSEIYITRGWTEIFAFAEACYLSMRKRWEIAKMWSKCDFVDIQQIKFQAWQQFLFMVVCVKLLRMHCGVVANLIWLNKTSINVSPEIWFQRNGVHTSAFLHLYRLIFSTSLEPLPFFYDFLSVFFFFFVLLTHTHANTCSHDCQAQVAKHATTI